VLTILQKNQLFYVTAHQQHIAQSAVAVFLCIKENMPIDHEPRKRMLGHIDRWKSSGMAQ
jgi:hypothetical protein